MSSEGNLFERVDGVESKVDDVSAKMDNLTAKIDGLLSAKQTVVAPRQTENPQVVLKRFISKAKKEYCWLGTESDFQKDKNIAIILMLALISVLAFSTFLTSKASGLYTTFTFFENIWLIMMCKVMIYLLNTKRFYDCYKFAKSSCFKYELDADGIPNIGALKKKYKVFLVLTCICALFNIVYLLTVNSGGITIWAIIFELLVIGLSIFAFIYKTIYFFCGYDHIRFTGKSETTKERLSIIYIPDMNQFCLEEDYKKTFPF